MADGQNQEELLPRVVLEALPHGVLLVDQAGVIRYANASAAKLLDASLDLLCGTPASNFWDDWRSFSLEKPTPLAYQDMYLLCHARAIVVSDSNIEGTLLTLMDYSAQHALLDHTRQYLSTALMEIRAPITPIRGFADLLLLGAAGPLSDGQREFLEVIRANGNRLRKIADNLLECSRLDSGYMRPILEEIPLEPLLEEIRLGLAEAFLKSAVALQIYNHSCAVAVYVDGRWLRHVLFELLDNARRYTYPEGVVNMTVSDSENQIRFDIQDTGVGIEQRYHRYIFTRFFRADNPLRDKEGGGTGLSLAIVKGLIELHGGRIWFESAAGEGSTFSFTLPLVAKKMAT